jgi:hypothetical protein
VPPRAIIGNGHGASGAFMGCPDPRGRQGSGRMRASQARPTSSLHALCVRKRHSVILRLWPRSCLSESPKC